MVDDPSVNKQKPKKSAAYRRFRLLLFIVLCFMSWAGVTIWGQVDKLNAKETQLDVLSGDLAEVQGINDGLKQEIVRLNDPEYIEQKVKKEYHYSRPGETLFYVPKSNP